MRYNEGMKSEAKTSRKETEMEMITEQPTATAAKVRRALKAAFPGVKFTVTTSRYSMGSSVEIGWTDGPELAAVDAVAQRFQSVSSSQRPDDSVERHGYVFEGQRFFGAHYVSCNRTPEPLKVRGNFCGSDEHEEQDSYTF